MQGLRARIQPQRLGSGPRALVSSPIARPARCHRAAPPCVCQAKGDGQGEGIVKSISNAVDTVADFVPETVPRGVARAGVAIGGGLIVFGLVKQVLSGIFTLALMGGLAYWWLTKNSPGGDDDDEPRAPKKSSKADDLDDPLADARRIMDKYK